MERIPAPFGEGCGIEIEFAAKAAYLPDEGVCGNGICDGDETMYSCMDCAVCGDGCCAGGERSWNCSQDCGSVCGDGFCTSGETAASCRSDCAPKLGAVNLERVRSCRNRFPLPCNSTQTRSEFHWWDYFNVAQDKQKRTYLAQPFNPGRDGVRHLVFIAAGQQDGDHESRLTGQDKHFKNGFRDDDGSQWVPITSDSLAYRLMAEVYRSPEDTFMGLAFDARFNYGFTPSNKQEIENAYYEWLKDKFYANNLQSIYLAGHSRGGCLAARLGRRFKQDFPQIPLIIHIFDGVCHVNDGEFGTNGSGQLNPLMNMNDYWRTYSSDIGAQFPTTHNLAVYNMVSGARVLPDFVDYFVSVHAFGYGTPYGTPNPQAASFTVGDWYRQDWYGLEHHSMANSNSTVSDALHHYQVSCNRFGC
ncbi:hypothetical protein OV208_16355 [Corallococcus sp. bb12-1]|uniref:hypothetical protein n=1 Tax=Corallococcus sp. bb12-1 TaxID=2996784 RepID=UPI00226E332A|nr:hypothetical protein [Corallococcus sp. bb12-1]MCY1042893.1 hypothetical protein [Corallococcus sp. bb12-1]